MSMTTWEWGAVRGQAWATGQSQGPSEPLCLPGSVHVKWRSTPATREIWSWLLFVDSE